MLVLSELGDVNGGWLRWYNGFDIRVRRDCYNRNAPTGVAMTVSCA